MSVLAAELNNPRQGGPSFSLANRLERLMWGVVWSLLGSWTPAPFHIWRRVLATSFGAKIAKTAKIYPGVRIWYPRNLIMNDYSCLGAGAICYSMDKVTLDRYALVSQGAHLCCGTHDIDDAHFQLITGPIFISANAWIAADAFVGPGVIAGEGSVLGARGVAFRNLLPWTVYAGNPAKLLRSRKIADMPEAAASRLSSDELSR